MRLKRSATYRAGFDSQPMERYHQRMATTKTAILPANAPAPIGPYTPAIRSGDLLFSSGQVGFDPATGVLVEGGIETETRQVMQNLNAILAAAGLGFDDVVKTTIFLADMADFALVNGIYAEAFTVSEVPAPARSTVQVAELPRKARIEIELIARFPAA